MFHAECVTPWLVDEGTCPLCKDMVSVSLHQRQPNHTACFFPDGVHPDASEVGDVMTTSPLHTSSSNRAVEIHAVE